MFLTGINAIDQYETEEEIPESFHGAALIQCVETNELWLSNGVTTERVGSHLSGSTTISVTDNIKPALRITQLGTGNALVVEDSTNPDSTPFVIDASGNVGIGATPIVYQTLTVSKNLTGFTSTRGIVSSGQIQSDSTAGVSYFSATSSTQATTFNTIHLGLYSATQGTFGVGSTVTNQYGVSAGSSLTGATNNYGFYGGIASGTGCYNLYMGGTADNYLAGSLGIGATPYTGAKLLISGNATNSSTDAVVITQAIQSSAITKWNGFATYPLLAAGSYTLPTLRHYDASFNTFGAGAAITNQYGYSAQSTLTGATNNYGFYGAIPAGTGRYNLYMGGTASNYFGGPLITAGLKATSAASPTIASATTIAPTTQIAFISGTTAIATITAPSPISLGGGQITLIPTGIFTTTTAGNIALASTAVVGKALIMTYDATTTKWYPSY